MVVLHINQRITGPVHLQRIRPHRTPDVHLQIFRGRRGCTPHIAQTPPQPHSPASLLHQTVNPRKILSILLSVSVILVHAYIYNLRPPKRAAFLIKRLPPEVFHKGHSLFVSQINLLRRLACGLQGVFRVQLCDGKRVGGGVNLRHHRHAIGLRHRNKLRKLLLRVGVLR